jgi:hypothetical protein
VLIGFRHAARQLPSWLIFDVRCFRSCSTVHMVRSFTKRRSVSVAREALVVKGSLPRITWGVRRRGAECAVWMLGPGIASSTPCRGRRHIACGPLASPESVRILSPLRRRFDPPNKAPEPTAGSVTPRANPPYSELNLQKEFSIPARGAPDPAVAHL